MPGNGPDAVEIPRGQPRPRGKGSADYTRLGLLGSFGRSARAAREEISLHGFQPLTPDTHEAPWNPNPALPSGLLVVDIEMIGLGREPASVFFEGK